VVLVVGRQTGRRRGAAEERAIKADKGAQRRLLDLQLLDTALAQLQHRRQTLPEHAELARVRAVRTALAADLVAADTEVSDLELEQSNAESELEPVRSRLVRNQHRIADGTVADPKALSGLIEEVDHLQRRIANLEDAELEVMEQLETAQASREKLRVDAAQLDQELATLTAKRDAQLSELDADVAERTAERDALAPEIPADLMALYTKVGATRGGVGAAELRQRRCTGCQLEVNAAELRQFAAATEDEVLRCEECGRILIRTENSGLHP
jgi:predicted  nucleic acid-binding Zn-ribbon protein